MKIKKRKKENGKMEREPKGMGKTQGNLNPPPPPPPPPSPHFQKKKNCFSYWSWFVFAHTQLILNSSHLKNNSTGRLHLPLLSLLFSSLLLLISSQPNSTQLSSHLISKIIHRHTFIRAWSLNLPMLSLCTPIRPSPTRASQPIGDGLDTILEAHCCCCHCRLTSTPLSANTITPRYNSDRDINHMIMMMMRMMMMICGGVVVVVVIVLLVGECW